MIDSALLRPGRFDKVLYVPPPTLEERLEILKIYTDKIMLDDDVDLCNLAQKTENFTGADMKSLCREATLIRLRISKSSEKVCLNDFTAAFKEITPTLSFEL